MLKNIIKFLKNNLYWIIVALLSCILSFFILHLNKEKILTPSLEIIQHLLTVASIVLGIITLNLTILLSIREGKIYAIIKANHSNLMSQLFGFAVAAIISSAAVIAISLLILSTKQFVTGNRIYRAFSIVSLSMSFINMIFDTSFSFIQNIQLLKQDDTDTNS